MKSSFLFLTLAILIVVTGFFIRYIALSHIIGPPLKIYPTMDEMDYREFAENIINYKQFSAWCQGFFAHSARAPVYPACIATVYKISGKHSLISLKYLNLFFDTFTIVVVFLLAYNLAGRIPAIVSSALYAFSGHALFYMLQSSPHSLGVLLFLSICLLLTVIDEFYIAASILLGILYSILIHTRPVFMVASPFLFLALFIQFLKSENNLFDYFHVLNKNPKFKYLFRFSYIAHLFKNWKSASLKALLPCIIAGTLSIPWIMRNYRLHNTFVPVCSISGWHIANNINFDFNLSIKFFVQELYKPERKHFTEGQYFILAKKKFFDSFCRNPIDFMAYGFARLLYQWTPHKPYIRFFKPEAYLFPMPITDFITLPLPDFEGLLYLFIAVSIFILFAKGGKTFFFLFFSLLKKFKAPCFLATGYALVHIIGIPLIAYRLFIEPIMIIFIVSFIYLSFKNIRIQKFDDSCVLFNNAGLLRFTQKGSLAVSAFLTFILLAGIFMPLFSNTENFLFSYPKQIYSPGFFSYSELRNIQWRMHGNLNKNTPAKIMGVIRYMHKGFKFVTEDYYAKQDFNFAAARLFCQYGNKISPLGIGDVRLNFPLNMPLPKNHSFLLLEGDANTGVFKEIIINVKNWKYLPISP